MSERNLKRILILASSVCFLLVLALAYLVWHPEMHARRQVEPDPVVARGSAASVPVTGDRKAGKDSADDGAPALADVQLSPGRTQQIGVTTATAEMKSVSDEVEVPGTVAMDEQRLSYVQTRYSGWIRTVYANATYQYVKKGQQLFTIYSPDLVSTEQEYLLAKNSQAVTSEPMHGMAAREGSWLVDAAEERLRRLDIPSAETTRIERSGTVQHEMAVESPASGYIIERNALPNAYIQPETKLYTIADLSTVWVYANLPQSDAGRIKPGNLANVTVDAYPGRHFSGRVDQILPEVDATTRTVKVRVVLSNPRVMLKPGMYVSVKVAAPLGRQLVIPASGVLQSGDRELAFVEREQGVFAPTRIETGPRMDDMIVVLKGLKAGDRVVNSANFLLDSEAQLQHEIEGSAAKSPQPTVPEQKSAEAMHIDLTTEPSPARRGTNTLHVKLAAADGKPIAGAQVQVTFFMPAMPAMGMAAMRVTSSLTDRGNGGYEGTIQLDSGGTWDVTITAGRNGQAVDTKKVNINAMGGM